MCQAVRYGLREQQRYGLTRSSGNGTCSTHPATSVAYVITGIRTLLICERCDLGTKTGPEKFPRRARRLSQVVNSSRKYHRAHRTCYSHSQNVHNNLYRRTSMGRVQSRECHGKGQRCANHNAYYQITFKRTMKTEEKHASTLSNRKHTPNETPEIT